MSCPLSSDRLFSFSFNAPATAEIYTLSLHDALPISPLRCTISRRFRRLPDGGGACHGHGAGRAGERHPAICLGQLDRKSTRLNSSHRCISYAVFCLKKKNKNKKDTQEHRKTIRRT